MLDPIPTISDPSAQFDVWLYSDACGCVLIGHMDDTDAGPTPVPATISLFALALIAPPLLRKRE